MLLLIVSQENDISLYLSPQQPTYIMYFRIKDSLERAKTQSR